MKWFDKLIGKKQAEPEKKPRQKKLSPKEQATKNGEPYVEILKVELDPANMNYGSFEIDWNEQFVAQLRTMGYPRDAEDEVVVDLWFQSVCRNILMETYEQESASPDNIRYINKKDLGGGKTEVS